MLALLTAGGAGLSSPARGGSGSGYVLMAGSGCALPVLDGPLAYALWLWLWFMVSSACVNRASFGVNFTCR